MSHSAHPYGFRLGYTRPWRSRWFNRKDYRDLLKADVEIREWLTKKLRNMYVSEIDIERSPSSFNIIIKTSRPGMIIGRAGSGAQKLKEDIIHEVRRRKLKFSSEINLSIEEVKSPETDAKIVSKMVAESLEKRLPFRRVMRQTLDKVSSHKEVEGVKIMLSGRLGGAEMSRKEWLIKGRIPLQTLRANIDFAREEAYLPYGQIGIKVWVYKGEEADKS